MAANPSAVRRKLIARGTPAQIARARAAITQTPSGALARRLGVDQPTGPNVDAQPKGIISARGRLIRPPTPIVTPDSLTKRGNVGFRVRNALVPGSRFTA